MSKRIRVVSGLHNLSDPAPLCTNFPIATQAFQAILADLLRRPSSKIYYNY